MGYLAFNTKFHAEQANSKISHNMGCSIVGVNALTGLPEPEKQKTESWAIPQETIESKWAFIKPDDIYMNGVTNYTESEKVEFKQTEA